MKLKAEKDLAIQNEALMKRERDKALMTQSEKDSTIQRLEANLKKEQLLTELLEDGMIESKRVTTAMR